MNSQIIHILVTLDVLNFDALKEFEQSAVIIMKKYGGKLITAFETQRDVSGTGREIHLIEFPDEAAFAKYRSDPDLLGLAALRERAIKHTEVQVSSTFKTYGESNGQ